MADHTAIRTLLLLRRGDEVLLAMKKRGFGVGHWNGVGGKLEPGENIEEATIRECIEEIGVTPLEIRKVAEHDFVLTNEEGFIAHTYICDKWSGVPTETEEMAPKWFKIADIPYNEMWQDDVYWLPAILAGRTLKTRFSFDDNYNMTSCRITEVAPSELQ